MRKSFLALLTGALVVALTTGVGASVAGSAAAPQEPVARGTDYLTTPLSEKQAALRAVGLQKLASGELPKGTKVAQVAKGQYVELAREDEDSIWTVLGEFGTQINPTHGGAAGPLHNEIPEPDRSVDNTTIWTADFSQAYFEDLLFDDRPGENSMRNYYKEQSSNRYAVNGEVTDWVQVPFNEANYGSNYCGSIVCARTWLFVRDSVNAWYDAQIAAGKTAADVNAELAKFDVWDRYDQDGDGNFDEPDGYIDHFQSVHAGMGEEVGGGAQGTNAIWSHRWYVQLTPIGGGGPTLDDGTVVPFGGTQVGGSKYWIGDYTIEPENGGVGVFAHEFAHDLDLPDEYDTSGNTGGAENSTAWWTLMSQGSYGTQTDDLGTSPTHMNAWDKFQLGWLNYEVASVGQTSSHRLGPAEYNTKQAQGVFVVLPQKEVPLELGAPFEGPDYFYSGSGNNLDNTMTQDVTVGAGAFSAMARYDIETDWDYAYLTVNGDPVATSLSTTTNPNNQNFGNGITGSSNGNWVALTADLSAYAGQTVTLGFRYWTDGAAVEPGFQVDAIELDGTQLDDGWTFDGFRSTTGSETQLFNNYYLAENRQYTGYDESLRVGPYNFGFPSLPNLVEHFPYQDGVLIWYWDTSHTDNNVGDHPGEGLILPIDSHPEILHWSDDGSVMRPRMQAFDATFSKQSTDAITVHNPVTGAETSVPSRPGVSVFDDLQDWWVSSDPGDAPNNGRYQSEWNSVNVPKTGTQIRIQSETKGGFTQIQVRPSK
jgi:immune inhibitor A